MTKNVEIIYTSQPSLEEIQALFSCLLDCQTIILNWWRLYTTFDINSRGVDMGNDGPKYIGSFVLCP